MKRLLLSVLLLAFATQAAPAKKKKKVDRSYAAQLRHRRERMKQICKAQGPTCHVPDEKGPRDLQGVQCVCD